MMARLTITESILSLLTILMENGFTIFIMLKETFMRKLEQLEIDFADKNSIGGRSDQYEKQKNCFLAFCQNQKILRILLLVQITSLYINSIMVKMKSQLTIMLQRL